MKGQGISNNADAIERDRRRAVGSHRDHALFIVSRTDRDALSDLASSLGWKATAVRRTIDAERRFLAGDAVIALVDVRHGDEAVLPLLADAVEACGGALIALIADDDMGRVPALVAAGVTHVIQAPLDADRLAAGLACAGAMIARLAGQSSPLRGEPASRNVATPERRTSQQRDFVTGLASRAVAIDWIERQLRSGDGAPIVLLLAIGPFERINAAYGEMAGDALLGRVARRIERLAEDYVGPDVMVARISGAEYFVGLTPGAFSTERAMFLARSLVAAVGQPFSAGDHLIRLTGRCGIAEALATDDPTRLLRRAGTALADARASDGEGIRILTAHARSREADPDQLESDLRLALDRNEIDIVFQPQYACADDRLIGVEALARWRHPQYGALGAATLFSAAERSDFLLPLSSHIQQAALRQAASWPQALRDVRLSLNVTASDIAQPGFAQAFLAMVDASGFPRARLTVEITESGLIENIGTAATILDDLRTAGLAVAIDDFGTGYSSLAYLKGLRLDYLKIDSGLAQDIAGSERDRIIVRGVIQMARSLGMKVIAEGVETEVQKALLTDEGCEVYQGFLRSRALTGADLVALFKG
ncbi:putative bifunctional diguanylate cyclase/phosphodiesterase [Sphingobium algorifonticola]|uniref:Bifunctional diguanylate cyclase/phosphodiesterase n=1 Tax=Sphingobium algorifonticola TaxID=2008318 RepID=A0A437J6B0_9SPHN|nr:bifunctional diguanylate cyclase/phosphodiesterase [Sphingobium algorifonticola]RVT40690.1 bifunctional diguanylate cyclase/phosphodiesterase [Sphingobium algorifonticola]